MSNLDYKKIENIGTPFFLFEEHPLMQELEALQNAFSIYWKHYKIGYSVKTNSFPPLAVYLLKQKISAEVVSEDEYQLVSNIGFTSEQIICNGPIKSKSWVNELLQKNILLNIDSHPELNYIQEFAKNNPHSNISVGIRVNLDIEKYFPNESNAGEGGSRFGFCEETGELLSAIKQLKEYSNISISGLHLHVSTKTRKTEIYRWLVQQFAQIINKYHLESVKYLDIGGGFYGGIPNKPNWNDYIKEIASELKKQGFTEDKIQLIVEPGVSLLASCFSYYCKVIDIKNTTYNQFIVLDGSRIHIDPLMHKSSYFYEIINQPKLISNSKINKSQQLVGFTCLENDRFFQTTSPIDLAEGDYIRFNKVGAYTLTLSPLFISYFPAVYTVNSINGEIECLRSKWGTTEFLQLSKI